MRRGTPPLNDPTKITIPVSASVRIRFEPNSRDAINSRIWESLKYGAKEPTSEDIKNASSPVFQDNNPISARNSQNNYNQQPQLFSDPVRTSTGVTTPTTTNNSYLERLDAVSDGRNFGREMRAAVYEDNRDRQAEASKVLAERQFSHRFLPEQEAASIQSIQAYELLRPKTDDYSRTYRQ
jgi:hypothetical protein